MKPWAPARARYLDGRTLERRCNKCSAWYPFDRMRKAAGCHGGRANECRLCYNDRKRLTREKARARV